MISQQSSIEFVKVQHDIMCGKSKYKSLVVSISRQSSISLSEILNIDESLTWKIQNEYFLSLGASVVQDLDISCKMVLREATNEFILKYIKYISRYNIDFGLKIINDNEYNDNEYNDNEDNDNDIILPQFTSECPGWICFVEKTQPKELLKQLSKILTPQELQGRQVKDVQIHDIDNILPQDIYHLSIEPCYDKKQEISRKFIDNENEVYKDIDLVQSTSELCDMLLCKKTEIEGITDAICNDNTMLEIQEQFNSQYDRWKYILYKVQDIKPTDTTYVQKNINNLYLGNTSVRQRDFFINYQKINKFEYNQLQDRQPGIYGSGSNSYSEIIFITALYKIFNIEQNISQPWQSSVNNDLSCISQEYIGNGYIIDDTINEIGLYVLYGKDTAMILHGRKQQNTIDDNIYEEQNKCFPIPSKYILWKNKVPKQDLNTIKLTKYKINILQKQPICVQQFYLSYGFRNIQNLIKQNTTSLKDNKLQCHYVEMMACPSGCLNGGGQVRAIDIPDISTMLYPINDNKDINISHDKPKIITGSLSAQKALVQNLRYRYTNLPICKFDNDTMTSSTRDIYKKVEELKVIEWKDNLFKTRFRSLQDEDNGSKEALAALRW